jgi:hypothetical protein
MQIPIVRGRGFTAEDDLDAPLTVIVDEDLAARFWPAADPIGRRVGLDREGEPLRTIVGVAARAHAEGDDRETWYLPFQQEPTGRSNEILHLMVRGASGALPTGLREAVAGVDPALAVFGTATMDELRSERLAQDHMGAVVAAVFAGAGLLLAVIGLYGLLAYQVELRRVELGTRVALGAGAFDIGSVIVGRTAKLYGIGVTVGAVLAVGLNEALSRVIDGVGLAGPSLFVWLAAVLGLAALVAAVLPVRRALANDPARVLQGG